MSKLICIIFPTRRTARNCNLAMSTNLKPRNFLETLVRARDLTGSILRKPGSRGHNPYSELADHPKTLGLSKYGVRP